MASLESLDASNRGIFSLVGLENAVGLRSLNLSNNQIVQLDPLTLKTSTNVEDAGTQLGPRDLKFLAMDGNPEHYKQVILASGPAAYYRLNESSGSAVFDASPNNNTGTLVGAAQQNASGSLLGDGTSYDFSGGQIQLQIPQIATADGAKNSISFWMYWDGSNSRMPVSFQQYDLLFDQGRFGFNTGNGDVRGISSAGLANRWVHVAAVFTNKTGTTSNVNQNTLYIDGVDRSAELVSSGPPSIPISATTNATISGWNAGAGNRFIGKIDEVAFFPRVLTPSEVLQQFNASNRSLRPPAALAPKQTRTIVTRLCIHDELRFIE